TARSVHALDHCRARPWPFPLERRRARLVARHLPVHGRVRLRPGTMGYAREPVFLLSRSHPDRPRPAHVVTTGPYALVRHPGYTAGILIIAASGPALGSWLAAALVVIFSLPFLLCRAITEDRILLEELAGYSDYAARVRWRLIPGIW